MTITVWMAFTNWLTLCRPPFGQSCIYQQPHSYRKGLNGCLYVRMSRA